MFSKQVVYKRMGELFKIVFVLLIFLNQDLTAEKIFLKEEFFSLENWIFKKFPKIEKQSIYKVVSENGKKCPYGSEPFFCLSFVYKKEFSVYQYPKLVGYGRLRICLKIKIL